MRMYTISLLLRILLLLTKPQRYIVLILDVLRPSAQSNSKQALGFKACSLFGLLLLQSVRTAYLYLDMLRKEQIICMSAIQSNIVVRCFALCCFSNRNRGRVFKSPVCHDVLALQITREAYFSVRLLTAYITATWASRIDHFLQSFLANSFSDIFSLCLQMHNCYVQDMHAVLGSLGQAIRSQIFHGWRSNQASLASIVIVLYCWKQIHQLEGDEASSRSISRI